MRLLLDSHVFVWCVQDNPRLSRDARRAIRSSAAEVFVSAASIWEIAIKLSVGRLRWRGRPGRMLDSIIEASGFVELPVTARHAAAVRDLPPHHADPFDRLLVAQAMTEGLSIVTADDALARYGVSVVPA
jgi:PIN domain nuclease of toxin-antitoxin system